MSSKGTGMKCGLAEGDVQHCKAGWPHGGNGPEWGDQETV